MKTKYFDSLGRGPALLAAVLTLMAAGPAHGDPLLTSWFTTYSGKYARIYTTDAAKAAGTAVTTWTNGSASQSLPAYDGIQEVDYSANWVYIRSTGLGSHIMGPWYLDSAHTQLFPNYPTNQQVLYRLPRSPAAGTNTVNGGGAIGYFVDGVSMFNSWDAFSWNGSADAQGISGAAWNRDAWVNEGVTFDPANAHQPGSAQYHYHANPPALRYFLGDHVTYTAATDTYSESTNAVTQHSPILGWVADGYPIYGPYGYSNATNSASGVRLMVSGYVPRNGLNGSDNLNYTNAVRSTIPAWAQRFYNLSASQSGPTVSSNYPFGRYMEDNAFLGDLTNSATGKAWVQGVDYDLDQYNGRYCVTPDYPNGTYAYFVSISSTGTPLFPYNIGRAYYGNPTGSAETALPETVTTNYLGGPNLPPKLSPPSVGANNAVTLAWSAAEGGTYKVLSSTNLTAWSVKTGGVAAQANSGSAAFTGAASNEYYAVALTNLASYQSVTAAGGSSGGSGGITSVSPTSYARGSSFTLTIYLNSGANPAPPPANAPVISVTIGSNTASSTTHVSTTEVQATFDLSGAAATDTVTVTFPGPMSDPTDYVVYTLANGFTVQ